MGVYLGVYVQRVEVKIVFFLSLIWWLSTFFFFTCLFVSIQSLTELVVHLFS